MVVLDALPSRAAKFLGAEKQLEIVAYFVGYQAQIEESSSCKNVRQVRKGLVGNWVYGFC